MTLRHRDSSSSCSQSVVAVWGESCSIWAAMMAAAVQRSSCGSQSLSGGYRGVNVEGHHCDDPLLNYRHNHIITLIRYDHFSLLINRRESSMVGEHRYTAGDKNATVSQRNHGNSAHIKFAPGSENVTTVILIQQLTSLLTHPEKKIFYASAKTPVISSYCRKIKCTSKIH